MIIETIALGASFRIATLIVQLVLDENKLSFYSGCSDIRASNWDRVTSVSALQIVAQALTKTNGSSLFLGVSTLMNCLNLMSAFGSLSTARCTRVMFWKFLYSMSIPTRSCLKGLSSIWTRCLLNAVVFLLLFHVMASDWWRWGFNEYSWLLQQGHCLNCSEVGVVSITLIRWCSESTASLEEYFYLTLTGMIEHLHRQQIVIAEMP